MKISVESISNLERKIKVVIPAEEIDNKTMQRLEKLTKTVKLHGFRPGKIPLSVVKQRFGDSVRQEVIEDAIQSSYIEALIKENLKPAGPPHVAPSVSKFGEPLKYAATFEVYPEITLVGLDKVKIKKDISKINDQDVDNMLQKLRKQYAEWKEADEPSKVGDRLTIDFDGTIKGKVFKGNSGKDFEFELGTGTMLPDFEGPLEGVKKGETVRLKLKFPKNYSNAEIANKKAEFVVKIHKVLTAELPEVNEDFCKKVGIKDGKETSLKNELRKNMQHQLEQTLESKFKNKIFNKLLELNSFEIPNVLVDNEIGRLQAKAKQQFAQYFGKKIDEMPEMPDFPKEEFEKEARERVSLGLILAEAIKKYDIKVDDSRVKERVRALAAEFKNPDEVVHWYYRNEQYLAEIKSAALEEQIIEKLQSQAIIIENNINYDEAMR